MKTYGVIQIDDLSISDSVHYYEIDAQNPEAALNKAIRQDKSDRFRAYMPDPGYTPDRFRNSYSIYEQNGHSLDDNVDKYGDPNENLQDLWTEAISDIATTY